MTVIAERLIARRTAAAERGPGFFEHCRGCVDLEIAPKIEGPVRCDPYLITTGSRLLHPSVRTSKVQRSRRTALHDIRNFCGMRLRGIQPDSPAQVEHPWQTAHAFFRVDTPLHVVTDGDVSGVVTTKFVNRVPG